MQSVTQHYLTFTFTPLSSNFRTWIFLSHVVAYLVSFDSRFETRKSDIIRPYYELFNACGGSCPSLPCLGHYVTFSFTTLSSSFGIQISSSHVVAYIVNFGFYLTFSFSPLISSFGIWIFSSHIVAYIVNFETSLILGNPILYGHAMRFLMHVVDHVPHYIVFDTMLTFHSLLSVCSLLHNITLPFHSLLSARVSEFGFFHPISQPIS